MAYVIARFLTAGIIGTERGVGMPDEFAPRSSKPTQADIAKQLGVTAAAVGLALNSRPGVSEELRNEVHRVAAEIGYQPNYAARAMRTNRSFMLGIVYRNLHNPAFLSLIEGFDECCNAYGYTVMVCSSRLDEDREVALINALAGRGIDGLAVMAINEEAAASAWHRFGSKPLAFLASSTNQSGNQTFSVRPEESEAIVKSVDLLADLGHRRIALTAGSSGYPASFHRTDTFLAATHKRGIEPVLISSGWDRVSVRRIVAQHLEAPDRATAIIANSDQVATAVYWAARDAGRRIPTDLSIIGHDDIDTAELLDPPLTTFKVDHYQMGFRAAEQLIEMAEGAELNQRDIILPVTMVVRGSTASPS